jgi:hypothetical protein
MAPTLSSCHSSESALTHDVLRLADADVAPPRRLANMFLPSGTTSSANYQFSLPDSGDFGAEAW